MIFRRYSLSLILIIFFVGVLFAPSTFGQEMMLKTDQSSYEYGDSIKVKVIIKNNTDSTMTIESGCTGGTSIRFNDYSFPNGDHLAVVKRTYEPGQKRTFIYSIIPHVHGLPNRGGEQMVYGYALSQADSLVIEAPKYLGGRMGVRFKPETEESERQAIRDSLGVVAILEQWDNYQMWQIEGHSIDSIAAEYEDDPRFEYINPSRDLWSYDVEEKISTASIPTEDVPRQIVLEQNYPNPFNPVTVIPYELQHSAEVKLEVLDLLGRRVEILVNRLHQAGRHEVSWNASGVPSGTYLYRLSVDDVVLTRQMMLIR